MKFNINYFKKIFSKSNIHSFDFVYIYSDFRFFLSQNLNNQKFIQQFIKIFLKNNQTIIVPSFSYSKKIFDVKKTKSEVGFLSNFLLKDKLSLRSNHPIFSYLAIGPKKNIVNSVGKSAFGIGCLHSKLLFNNCAFLHIGRKLIYGNTLIHHVEQNLNAKYRFEKKFKTKVYHGKKFIGSNFKAFVRKNNNKLSSFTFEKIIKNKKIRKLIVKLNNEKDLKSIFCYSFDDFYLLLHELYLKDNNIFIKKKS